MVNPENDCAELREIFDARKEWLAITDAGRSFALQSSEIELEAKRGRLILGFLSDAGFQICRVTAWQREGEKIFFDAAQNFGAKKSKIEFVPRLSAEEFSETVELAHSEKAQKIAQAIIRFVPKAKLVRVALNKENGRFAHIVFENSDGRQIAAVADVSDSVTPEILLSTAILTLEKLRARRKKPIAEIWIVADKKRSKKLQNLHALLRSDCRRTISIKEIIDIAAGQNEELKDVPATDLQTLWRGTIKKKDVIAKNSLSETARRIIEISPAEIDAVFARNGETLRFNGLPFARVRKIFDNEKVWFGTEKTLRPLHAGNYGEFAKLIEELKVYRRFDAPGRRHVFYANAPEAWLESILRRNIKLLDANLILSPVHHQFRAERDKIDLLAVRRDGRLVIIELKTAPDRETALQAADYWRKIENRRRLGNLESLRLFGETKIAAAPPLVYLAAPLLSHHRDTQFFIEKIIPEIEFYRFDLNEDWRRDLKVTRRG